MFRNFSKFLLGFLFLLASFGQTAQASSFDINLSLTGFTASQEAIFTQAENYWEGVISGYQTGISITSLDISAAAETIDGAGGILGSAGPRVLTSQGGYFLAETGEMRYDTADLPGFTDLEFYNVIVHEMAHVIGFGTLWGLNGVYTSGSYQYTGAAALAAFQTEFNQPGATFIPVESGGGPGTANGHWENNSVLSNDLMTGWLLPNPTISDTTLASFVDIGYVLAESSSQVPEPATLFLFGCGLLGITGIRRRIS